MQEKETPQTRDELMPIPYYPNGIQAVKNVDTGTHWVLTGFDHFIFNNLYDLKKPTEEAYTLLSNHSIDPNTLQKANVATRNALKAACKKNNLPEDEYQITCGYTNDGKVALKIEANEGGDIRELDSLRDDFCIALIHQAPTTSNDICNETLPVFSTENKTVLAAYKAGPEIKGPGNFYAFQAWNVFREPLLSGIITHMNECTLALNEDNTLITQSSLVQAETVLNGALQTLPNAKHCTFKFGLREDGVHPLIRLTANSGSLPRLTEAQWHTAAQEFTKPEPEKTSETPKTLPTWTQTFVDTLIQRTTIHEPEATQSRGV